MQNFTKDEQHQRNQSGTKGFCRAHVKSEVKQKLLRICGTVLHFHFFSGITVRALRAISSRFYMQTLGQLRHGNSLLATCKTLFPTLSNETLYDSLSKEAWPRPFHAEKDQYCASFLPYSASSKSFKDRKQDFFRLSIGQRLPD